MGGGARKLHPSFTAREDDRREGSPRRSCRSGNGERDHCLAAHRAKPGYLGGAGGIRNRLRAGRRSQPAAGIKSDPGRAADEGERWSDAMREDVRERKRYALEHSVDGPAQEAARWSSFDLAGALCRATATPDAWMLWPPDSAAAIMRGVAARVIVLGKAAPSLSGQGAQRANGHHSDHGLW